MPAPLVRCPGLTRPGPAAQVELLRRLARAGLRDLEAGAFVSPKAVPQMADSAAVLAAARRDPLLRRDAGVRLPVLVPNARGLEAALAAGASEVRGRLALRGRHGAGRFRGLTHLTLSPISTTPTSTTRWRCSRRPRRASAGAT